MNSTCGNCLVFDVRGINIAPTGPPVRLCPSCRDALAGSRFDVFASRHLLLIRRGHGSTSEVARALTAILHDAGYDVPHLKLSALEPLVDLGVVNRRVRIQRLEAELARDGTVLRIKEWAFTYPGLVRKVRARLRRPSSV